MAQDPRWKEVQKAIQAATLTVNELIPALCKLIDSEAWREFVHPMRGVQRYDTFGSFCVEVMKIKPDAIEVMLAKSYAKDEAEKVRRMIREDIAPMPEHGEVGRGRQRVDNINSNDGGTDPSYLLARLKRDDPALAQRVVDGELSARGAALQAGIVKPTFIARADNLDAAMRAILKRYSLDDVRAWCERKASEAGRVVVSP